MSKERKKLSKVFSAIAKKQGAKRAVSLPGPGLTHDHYVLEGTGRLLRVPRRNQLEMTPEDYLVHQKKVYEAAAPSGATPKVFDIVPPQKGLPNGALVIEYIESRKPETDEDRLAMARALAKLNTTTSKDIDKAAQPFASQWFVINDIFGSYLQGEKISPEARKLLADEKDALEKEMNALAGRGDIPVALIGADSHAGNFIINKNGDAFFVDLEFLTADVPYIDAADAASPLTSQLDPTNKITFSEGDRQAFYKEWGRESGYDKSADFDKLMNLAERMVEFRTLAWLAYWLEEGRDNQTAPQQSRDNWDRMAKEYLSKDALEKRFTNRKDGAKVTPRAKTAPKP